MNAIRALLRRRSTQLILALIVIILGAGLYHFQGPRCCLYGWLTLEPTYHGFPASYWRAVVLDRSGPRAPTSVAPASTWVILWEGSVQHYERHYSLGVQDRHLRHDDPALLPILAHLLNDSDPRVRQWALAHLAYQKELARAKPPLLAILAGSDVMDRAAAMASLARIGPDAPEALPHLRAILAEESAFQSNAQLMAAFAIKSIDRQDHESLQFLMGLLKEPERAGGLSNRRQMLAAIYLGLLGSDAKEALPLLLELARSDEPVIASIARNAIQRIDADFAERELPLAEPGK